MSLAAFGQEGNELQLEKPGPFFRFFCYVLETSLKPDHGFLDLEIYLISSSYCCHLQVDLLSFNFSSLDTNTVKNTNPRLSRIHTCFFSFKYCGNKIPKSTSVSCLLLLLFVIVCLLLLWLWLL